MRRHPRLMNQINVVPYIDVMLVLLVIFMVTAPLMNPGVIDLPTIGKASAPPAQPIEISIRASGALSYIDRDLSNAERPLRDRDELLNVIKSKQSKKPNQPVVISAAKDGAGAAQAGSRGEEGAADSATEGGGADQALAGRDRVTGKGPQAEGGGGSQTPGGEESARGGEAPTGRGAPCRGRGEAPGAGKTEARGRGSPAGRAETARTAAPCGRTAPRGGAPRTRRRRRTRAPATGSAAQAARGR